MQNTGLIAACAVLAVAADARLIQRAERGSRAPEANSPIYYIVKAASCKPVRFTGAGNAAGKTTTARTAADALLTADGFTISTVANTTQFAALLV